MQNPTGFCFHSFYEPLHYNIYTPDNDIAKDLSGPVSNNQVISGTFGNSGSSFNTRQHAFEVRIPAEQFVQRGTYRDQVDVSLYEGRGLNAESLTLVGRETVTLTSETPIVAQISISGQSDYTMDFGILQSGASRSAELQYRTNAGFSIDAMSENNGVMVNTMQPESVAVPYQLMLNGNLVDLTDSSVVGQDLLFGTTIDFESVPLTVTIGTMGQVLPGLFQDVITFTITTF